jgi:hypothetical protein
MSSDSWKEDLADELEVDKEGIDLVDRVIDAKVAEGELSEEGLLSGLSRRDLLSHAAGIAGGGALLSTATGEAAADPEYGSAVGEYGTEQRPAESVVAQNVTTEQLGAETVNTVRRVSADDSNLQSVVDDVVADGGGTIYLESGRHDQHDYPIMVDGSNIYIKGAGGRETDTNEAPGGVILDAGGGRAITVDASERLEDLRWSGFAVSGTMRVDCQIEGWWMRDVTFGAADSGQDSGRGLDVRSGINAAQFYNASLINVGGFDCDGAIMHFAGIGQSVLVRPWGYNSAATVDGSMLQLTGGANAVYKPYFAGYGDVAAIQVDSGFHNDIHSPCVEITQDGIVLSTDQIGQGGCYNNNITGGTLNIPDRSGWCIRLGDSGGSNKVKASTIQDTFLRGGTGELLFGSGSQYNLLRPVKKGTGNKSINEGVRITNNGFQNQMEPLWHNRANGGSGVDTSAISPTFNGMVEIDDGTNTNSGNPGLGVFVNGTWYYMN